MKAKCLYAILVAPVLLLSGFPAYAQFQSTVCPILHPVNQKARLNTAYPLEDGIISGMLPDPQYTDDDGTEVAVYDYRRYEELFHRFAKLKCSYRGAPDIFLDIPGILMRCEMRARMPINPKADPIYISAYCESDISGTAN